MANTIETIENKAIFKALNSNDALMAIALCLYNIQAAMVAKDFSPSKRKPW